MHRLILLLACLLLGQAASSDEPGPDPVSTLSVDLGEVVENAAVLPVDGVTSSGQPDEAALRVFRDSGYVAVVDLRGEAEDRGIDEKSAVEALGMEYVPLPIEGRGAINFDNAAVLDDLIDSFDGPVLIHCGSGNRVGALLALRQSLWGASDEEAIEAGRAGGLTRSEDVVRERLAEK